MDNTEFQNKPQYQEEEVLDLKNIIVKVYDKCSLKGRLY